MLLFGVKSSSFVHPAEMFQLTLDPPTVEWLRGYYANLSGVILEYGSGGSSLLALKSNARNHLYSCETDSLWMSRLGTFMTQEGLSERFHPIHCDVGPTKEWGYPDDSVEGLSHARATQFMMAAWTPWKIFKKQAIKPDFILIDGRWRVPSFLAAMTQCEQPTMVLFDDYLERKNYHVVEQLCRPVKMLRRAALFEIQPSSMSAKEFLADFLPLLLRPE